MSNTVVARNYAEALLVLGRKDGDAEGYGRALDAVAGAVSADPRIEATLMSPRVTRAAKIALFTEALEGRVPAPFVRFIESVVRRDRQNLLGRMAFEYAAQVDVMLQRVHAGVVTARPIDAALQAEITTRLAAAVGKTVVPHFRTDARVLGGLVVRVGDRVFDGSIRRRLRILRRRMLDGRHGGSA